jgi:hypothetical protein
LRVRLELSDIPVLVDVGQVPAPELLLIEAEVRFATSAATGDEAAAGDLGAGATGRSAVERVAAVVRDARMPSRKNGQD